MSVDSPSVSLIVPVRNSGTYLRRCIDSVISQKEPDWELLLVNDGSTDDTCDIAREYSSKDNRIRLIESDGSGVSAARNLGIGTAKGRYIGFVDSDDLIEPGYVSELLELADSTDADISQCSFSFLFEDGSRKSNPEVVSDVFDSHEDIMNAYFAGMIGKVNLASWGKLYAKELLKDIRFDESLTIQEDAYFTFQCCMRASKIVCSDTPLYLYFQNPASVMNRPFDGSKMQYFTVLDRELECFRPDEDLALQIMRRKMITALDLTTEIVRRDCGSEYLERLRVIATDSSDKIKGKIRLDGRNKLKLFVIRRFPGLYYSLLKLRR